MNVVVSQFEGIDNTPGLPLAAGCLIASARMDSELRRVSRFAIAVERVAIEDAVSGFARPVGVIAAPGEGTGGVAGGAPDVLGFSLYPWNAAYSLAVAERARARYPHCLLVAGGPAVPRRPASCRAFLAAHPYLDVLVFAEGELTFRALLLAHYRQTELGAIGGVACRRRSARHPTASEIQVTAAPTRIHQLDETASPYLDGTFDTLLAAYPGRFTMGLCETNRGCPFTCTFCDWSLTRHVVEFPMDRVYAEIAWMAQNGLPHLCITDANFGIRPRDHDIARHIAAQRAATGNPTYCYFYLTKNNHRRNLGTIEILHAAGIGCCVGLAVQDFDDDVLLAVKRDNIQSGESIKLRDICAARAIPTHNELILGLPGQTCDSFVRTLVTAMPGYPLHRFEVYLCRLLDNTELASPASRRQFALQTRRCLWRSSRLGWDPVLEEYQELVVGTRDMPIDQWRRTYRMAYLASALYNRRLLRVIMQYLTDRWRIDLGDYLAFLCARTYGSRPGDIAESPVFLAIGRVFQRYTDSILEGGPFSLSLTACELPVDSVELASDGRSGADVVPIDDAVTIAAMGRIDSFYSEAERHTRAFLDQLRGGDAGCDPVLDEVFAVQRLLTPRFGQRGSVRVSLGHDWPDYLATGGSGKPLRATPLQAEYRPPAYVQIPDFERFVTTHVACLTAGMDTGTLSIVVDAALGHGERVARTGGQRLPVL